MKLNPKEKANDIFKTLLFMEDELSKYPMCFDTAKQASIYLIDEILEATIKYVAVSKKSENVVNTVYDDYWNEVKKEIESYK